MSAILQAFKDADLRKKILISLALIILYRIGAVGDGSFDFSAPFGTYLHSAHFVLRSLRALAPEISFPKEEDRHVRFCLTLRAAVHGMHRSVRFFAGRSFV